MLNQIQSPIKNNLEEFDKIFASSLKCEVPLINQMVGYLMEMRGKQMRPTFLLLAAKLVGDVNSNCYNGATMIELIHTASLVHDDVVDEAFQRRGKLSMNALYRSKGAVLAGDYILARALRIASQNKLYPLIDFMADVIEQMSTGELQQSDFSVKLNITTPQYFEVIKRKTALLLATCGWAGAKFGGGSEEECKKIYEFGELLGMAFQIKDDILDFTYQSSTGKIACNDLKEQKLTLPIISILERASNKERAKILADVRKASTSTQKLNSLRDLVINSGGIKAAEDEMSRLYKESLAILATFKEGEVRNALERYAQYILTRNK